MPELRLREYRGSDESGFWMEWYCDVPPVTAKYRVHPGDDEWFEDPVDGRPVRRIYAVEVASA